MKKQHLTQTGRSQASSPNLPSIPKCHYPVKFSHIDDSDRSDPKRIYYADSFGEAMEFVSSTGVFGYIVCATLGTWEVRI